MKPSVDKSLPVKAVSLHIIKKILNIIERNQ
jgi:hypothetical protein